MDNVETDAFETKKIALHRSGRRLERMINRSARRVEKPACHSEMHEELGAVVENEAEPFTFPIDRRDRFLRESTNERTGRHWTDDPRIVRPDSFERRTDHAPTLEAATSVLDLGKFGHPFIPSGRRSVRCVVSSETSLGSNDRLGSTTPGSLQRSDRIARRPTNSPSSRAML